MMYHSPIEIKREPQKVQYKKDVRIYDSYLTLKKIAEHVGENDKFEIFTPDSDNWQGGYYLLEITCERMETPDETAKRIAKEESYMEGYRKHHEKYGRK